MSSDYHNKTLFGDAIQQLKTLPDGIVQMCVTSPPYWGLRQYLPDRVQIKQSLSKEEKEFVISELKKIGVSPIDE